MQAFNDMAEQLEASRQRLIYLTRLAGWQTLARKMAHEIKNSLTPIRLTMDELVARGAAGDRAFLEQAAEIVTQEVESLERRVRAFSDLAAEPPVRPMALDVNSLVEGSVAGTRCAIGPFARLRPGTRLGDGVHVGNFVEVKNSEIGAGSKANHLSYIGDSTVGAKVNVGAGTITCNYDGADKHRTTIGDGAFIGSGTMLVAPVSVGEGATIGAGSTITKPAPAGKLTVERGRQVTVETWKRPEKTPR